MYVKFFKRFFDFIFSLIAVVVLSPVLLALIIVGAVAMRGNPFFVQPRPGKKGKEGQEKIFKLVKFRTMDNRKDKDGNERQLHVKQSIDVTTVPYKPYDLGKQVEETIENGTRKELVSSNYLTLNKYDMTGYNKVKNDKPFQLVSIIEGQGTVEGKEVKKGDHFVVCSDQKEVDFDGTMTVMICTL